MGQPVINNQLIQERIHNWLLIQVDDASNNSLSFSIHTYNISSIKKIGYDR